MSKRRPHLVLATLGVGAAFAAVEACSTPANVAAPLDAAVDAHGPMSDAGADADGGVCAPGDTSKLSPKFRPPKPFHSGKCSDAEIASYYTSCFQSSGAVAAAFRKDHPACISCIESEDTDPARGVLVWYSNFSYYYLNVGGCIANEQGNATPTSCGAALQANQTCELAACQPTCPVSSETTYQAFNACTSRAHQEGCARFGTILDTSCGDIGAAAPNVASCTAMGRGEKAHVLDLVTRFCGGAPSDAGPDAALDGAAGDAGDAGDGGSGTDASDASPGDASDDASDAGDPGDASDSG